MSRDERGFTLIEILVVIGILSVVSVGFYTVLFSGTRSGENTRAIVRQSEEARLAFNRMVRDIREADRIVTATPTSVHVEVDFDADDVIAKPTPNADGDYEDLTFTYDPTQAVIRLNGSVLIEGVSQVGSTPVFSYSSSRLEHDTDGDGVVTHAELVTAANGGADVVPDSALNLVSLALKITVDGRQEDFFTQAELRNNR